MTEAPDLAARPQARVLLLPPTRRDGELVRRLLGPAGLEVQICRTLGDLGAAIDDHVAAVVATDDGLESGDLAPLGEALGRQPEWSDLPFVVLAASGPPKRALGELQTMASVTLLDRSVHMRTLLSAVQMAVRARTRQYQIRDLLERERQARVEANRANEAKDRFLAVLSHELRTPLTPIVFALAALQREFSAGSPRRRESDTRLPRVIEMISRNIALETKLIDDLLDLSRLVQGKLQLQKDVVNVHERLQDTLGMVETDARAKEVTIQTTLDATRPYVIADAARIHQVLWNLLKNAIKFTPSGGTVTIRTWEDAGRLMIAFEDTGIGIPADVLPRLFEPFEQGSAEITRHYGGLGLGLAVGRSLVVAHGGSLTAVSAGIDKGSTFTVALPSAAAPEAEPSHPAAAPSGQTQGDHRRLNILLVEDHEDTAHTLRESLASLGHRVRVAGSVGEALREAASDPCDLLISDIGLPDGSGVDLIRQIDPRPVLGAIAMSGFGMEEDLLRSRNAGFHRHLTKPVELAVLERAIAALARSAAGPPQARSARKPRAS
jgi:signal transduction histidine kinase/ActR/RegA family two-component response regulator